MNGMRLALAFWFCYDDAVAQILQSPVIGNVPWRVWFFLVIADFIVGAGLEFIKMVRYEGCYGLEWLAHPELRAQFREEDSKRKKGTVQR